MSVMGVWVVGVVADDALEEARRRFPDAAGTHGTWPESSAVTSWWRERFEPAGLSDETPQWPRTDEIAHFAYAVDRVRNDETEVEEFQDYLLHAVPQQEGESLFCAAVPRGDGAAALMWGLGIDTTLRLPGCCGQFLLDAAQVRAVLPAAEQALVLHPSRRVDVATRIRLWLDEMADDPNLDVDELIDGPLRVLRYAARTGVGAVGLTLWY
ncbi:hypothetical protein OHB41_25560 [Streptomyces sp. NBC_01571]|uniref:hypothetical protein n=1 Tax=Streptomyces sp. NBC_01571 TaxID=2975883 RepID=UPI00224D873F|nr:hypothetical protein [Streptomyces sp. NBC_01571]MCX4576482.1 hypothetical protein [Streptomyces sp. NBC_01571]